MASELDKNRKKLVKQQEELQATDHAEDFRQKGELLTTYLHQVPNDQPVVTLDNYYTGQPIEIDLDVALTPSQNAQRYFKKYQKLKEAVKHLTNLIEETKASIAYLESVELLLQQASLSEIDELRDELIETGYLKRRHREKIAKRQKPERYLASDGKTIAHAARPLPGPRWRSKQMDYPLQGGTLRLQICSKLNPLPNRTVLHAIGLEIR